MTEKINVKDLLIFNATIIAGLLFLIGIQPVIGHNSDQEKVEAIAELGIKYLAIAGLVSLVFSSGILILYSDNNLSYTLGQIFTVGGLASITLSAVFVIMTMRNFLMSS